MQIKLFSCQNICESYLPVVSQVAQLHHLIRGCGSTEEATHHYSLLGVGSLVRSIVLMIPVLGNLIIFLYDVARQRALHRVLEDWRELEHVSDVFKDDVDIVRAAFLQNEDAFEFASAALQELIGNELMSIYANGLALQGLEWLQGCRGVVEAAICQNEAAIEFVSQPLQATIRAEIASGIQAVQADGLALEDLGWLKGVERVVRCAVQKTESALQFAIQPLRGSIEEEIADAIETVRANGLALQNCGWLTGVESVVRAAVYENEEALQYATPELQLLLRTEIAQGVQRVIESHGWAFRDLGDWLRGIKTIVKLAVKKDGLLLQYVGPKFQNNKEIVQLAVVQNENALQYASQALQVAVTNEIRVCLVSVQRDGLALKNFGWLRGVQRVVKEAVYENEEALQYATLELQESMRNYIRKAIKEMKSSAEAVHEVTTHPDLKWLQGVFSIMQCVIEQRSYHFRLASPRLQNNEEFVKWALQEKGSLLFDVHRSFQNDESMVRLAIQQNAEAIRYANVRFQCDKEFMKWVVCQDKSAFRYGGRKRLQDLDKALQYASADNQESIQKEINAGIDAVQINGLALENLGWLRGVREVVIEAMKENEEALNCATLEVQKEIREMLRGFVQTIQTDTRYWFGTHDFGCFSWAKDLVRETVKRDGLRLQHASKKCRDDEELVRLAIAQNPEALRFASERLQTIILAGEV